MQEQGYIFEVDEQNLQQVLEQSMQVPVIVDFWADWCQPCLQMAPVLEQLVNSYQGKVLLAKVNADQQQAIAGQFGVRSLPTLKLVWQGRLAGEQTGLQSEKALREWLDPIIAQTAPPDEAEQELMFLDQVRAAIEQGQGAQAEAALQDALAREPDRHAFRALLVEYLLGEGRTDEAQTLLADVADDDVEPLRPFRARFALLESLTGEPAVSLDELAARLQNNPAPEDLHAYGLRAAAAGHFREGLEALLQLLRDHRDYRDGAARGLLLQVFECLPKGDPLASEYRRRMFNYLY